MEMNKFNQTMEALKYYENEFLERQKSFWKLLTRFFTLEVIVDLLPFASAIGGLELRELNNPKVMYVFPGFGVIFALLSFWILWQEGKRIILVNQVKYQINNQLPEKMRYKQSTTADKKVSENQNDAKRWLSRQLPVATLVVELLMSIGSIVLCHILL